MTLERFEDHKMVEKINAQRIQWDSVKATWTLHKWNKRTILPDRELLENGDKLDTLLNLQPTDFDSKAYLETTLTMPELNDYIALQFSRGADDVQIYRVEKYIRIMQPFSIYILMFVALIISARKSRKGVGFTSCLGLF